jgi:flagellar hook assembly protein FlgD
MVRKFNEYYVTPGVHEFSWNATNEAGIKVKKGLYHYRLAVDEKVNSGKIIFMD